MRGTMAKLLVAGVAVSLLVGLRSNLEPASSWSVKVGFPFNTKGTHRAITENVIGWFDSRGWKFNCQQWVNGFCAVGERIQKQKWADLEVASEQPDCVWWAGLRRSYCDKKGQDYLPANELSDRLAGLYHRERTKQFDCHNVWGNQCPYHFFDGERGAERQAADWAYDASQVKATDLATAQRWAGYAVHFAQDAVNPPHVDPWKMSLDISLDILSPHTKFERYVDDNWRKLFETKIELDQYKGPLFAFRQLSPDDMKNEIRQLIRDLANETDEDWDGPPGEDYPTCPGYPFDEYACANLGELSAWPDWDPFDDRGTPEVEGIESRTSDIVRALNRAAFLTQIVLIYVFDFAPPPPAALLCPVPLTAPPLYIGTQGGPLGDGDVYRCDEGLWQNVSPTTDLGQAVMDLINFGGTVYAATQTESGYGGGAGSGQVWRYDGGTSWTKVGEMDNSVMALTAYGGELYAATNQAKLYKYNAPGNWTEVASAPGSTGFFSAITTGIGGQEQIVIGELNTDAFWTYTTSEGLVFREDHGGSCVWGFAEYLGELYSGHWHGPIYKTSDARHWSLVADTAPDHNWDMVEYRGELHIGSGSGGDGVARLRTYDGSTLTTINAFTVTENAEGIISLATDGTILYYGTGVPDGYYGGDGVAEVWTYDGTTFRRVSAADQFGGGVQSMLVVN